MRRRLAICQPKLFGKRTMWVHILILSLFMIFFSASKGLEKTFISVQMQLLGQQATAFYSQVETSKVSAHNERNAE